MRLRVLPILLVVLAAAGVPLAWSASSSDVGVGHAARQRSEVARSPDLWATINVCDTAAHPDTIGIRGSMPGLKRTSTLWMRIRVQYLATAGDGKWHDVAQGADSGWKRLARLKTRVVETGQDFEFLPPAAGAAHRLRGSVTFKWVRRGRVVERLHRVTEAGHRSTAGADPEGYSAAVCEIT